MILLISKGLSFLSPQGYRRKRKRRRRRSRWSGRVRLAALFVVLLGINGYVFFIRGGTSIQDVLKTSAIRAEGLGEEITRPESSPRSGDRAKKKKHAVVVRGSLKGHLGLTTALAASHLDTRQVNEVIRALKPVLDFRNLRPAHTYEIYLNPRTRRLEGLSYRLSRRVSVEVTRQENGTLTARRTEAPLETKPVTVGGTVGSSLNQSVISAGGDAALAAKFVQLFSWDINWYVDPRKGDAFRILAEKKFLNGKFYRFGRILAAEYRGKSVTKRAFYQASSATQGGYVTEEGRSIRRAFLKTPLSYRRMSSKYDLRRFHPVLKRTRPHNGVDFAAARGTPVWAAADGWVTSASRSRGSGNMVILRHSGGIVTLYMHLHRFARGLKAGMRVKQRQMIGTVGATGLATGPHLHYGMKVKGRYVDPLSFKTPRGALLPSEQRSAFLAELPRRIQELEAISVAK